MTRRLLKLGVLVACLGTSLAFWISRMSAQSNGDNIKIDGDDIGGVVTSDKGPEAGVWVIAETTDLPTRLIKIVVTDDRGRYLIPDLPKANYSVWVRGYGLVDSPKTHSAPGKMVNLKAATAPDAHSAAQIYPANYWYSLLRLPQAIDFPGTGPSGNGINPNIKSLAEYIHMVKTDGCTTCHELGNKATREIPAAFASFDSPSQAWERRIQSGQAGAMMMGALSRMGTERAAAMLGDWTTRVKSGELPPTPPRPQGIERNVVITEWDWSDAHGYLHDEISTDKRNPTLNANGLIYGSPEESHDWLPVLDPVHNTVSKVQVPYRDPKTPGQPKPLKPSAYWGDEAIWDSHTTVHNPMFDQMGRLWFTSRIRPNDNPAYCKAGSDLPSAKLFPLNTSGRQLAVYDPKTKQVSLVDTCFSTHHLQFAEDANYTLWTSSGGGGGAVGWINTKMWDRTHDEKASQGWTALILDTNGNGKRDDYVEPDQPLDPNKDKRIAGSFYGVTISPADGTIWGTILGFPGGIARINPGSHPPETALTEYYELPWNNAKAKVQGFSPRGLDIDTNGVVWTVLASGHFASFDRRKCKVTNGPTATGQQCPEGWTLYPLPGPQFQNLHMSGSADTAYYDWVDQHNTLGLGNNVPIATGSGSDSLLPVVNGKFVVMRIPYPLGFYTKGLDGRIDDPNAGWKGRGVWTTLGSRVPFHMETGKGTLPKVAHFQVRPDPLAN